MQYGERQNCHSHPLSMQLIYDEVEALRDMLTVMACGWELINMVKVAYKFHMLMILVCELT